MNDVNYNFKDNKFSKKVDLEFGTTGSATQTKQDDIIYDSTSGTTYNITIQNYSIDLPDKLNIFKNILNLSNIKDETVKTQISFFVEKFKITIFKNKLNINSIGGLPPLKLNILDDGSVLIEWIFKDFRIGFSFEIKESESGWSITSSQEFNNKNAYGDLSSLNMEDVLENILSIVLVNS